MKYDVTWCGGHTFTVDADSPVDAVRTALPRFIGVDISSTHYSLAARTEPRLRSEPQGDGSFSITGYWTWKVEPARKRGYYTPRTQKAKGIAALGERTIPHTIYPIEEVEPAHLVGFFARPCPCRPRHGFVDSRLIETEEEATKLIAATREADPEAEIVVMKKVDAVASGIWTPGLLTVGAGNDGATQGKGALQIPVQGIYPWGRGEDEHNYLLEAASVREAPYVELLWKSGDYQPTPVQLRDGPKLPQAVNFVPFDVKVKRVIHAEGDLLEWESRMKQTQPGDVVYHPGGSLASHYAIHCVLNNVPCLIDRKPIKGQEIKAESHIRGCDIEALRAGFLYAQYWKIDQGDAARVMVAATHCIAQWKGRLDFLLGLGLGCAYRLAVTAGLGEYRHHNKEPGKKVIVHSRDRVYDCYYHRPLQGITAERVHKALQSFADPTVPAWQGGGYGGRKWYDFLKWAPLIHNQLLAGYGNAALESLNCVTNAVHNNGWGFNKFIGESTFNEGAVNPLSVLILVAPLLYGAYQKCNQKNMVRRFLKRKPMDIPPAWKPKKMASAPAPAEDMAIPQNSHYSGVKGGEVIFPAEITEPLFIVQKKNLFTQKWTNTAWTHPGVGCLAVPPKAAAEALALAQQKYGGCFNFRIVRAEEGITTVNPEGCQTDNDVVLDISPGPTDLYIVEKKIGTGWLMTAWTQEGTFTAKAVPLDKAVRALHQAKSHYPDVAYRLVRVAVAANEETKTEAAEEAALV